LGQPARGNAVPNLTEFGANRVASLLDLPCKAGWSSDREYFRFPTRGAPRRICSQFVRALFGRVWSDSTFCLLATDVDFDQGRIMSCPRFLLTRSVFSAIPHRCQPDIHRGQTTPPPSRLYLSAESDQCHSASGKSRKASALRQTSCTRFSPKTRRPAAYASRLRSIRETFCSLPSA